MFGLELQHFRVVGLRLVAKLEFASQALRSLSLTVVQECFITTAGESDCRLAQCMHWLDEDSLLSSSSGMDLLDFDETDDSSLMEGGPPAGEALPSGGDGPPGPDPPGDEAPANEVALNVALPGPDEIDDSDGLEDAPEHDSSDPEWHAHFMRPGGPGRELLGGPAYRPSQVRPYRWQNQVPMGIGSANAKGPPVENPSAARQVFLQDGGEPEPERFAAAPWNRNRGARGQPRQGQGAAQPSQAAGQADTVPSGRDVPVLGPRTESLTHSVERPGGNPGEERAILPDPPPAPPLVRREPVEAKAAVVVRQGPPRPSCSPLVEAII